MIDTISCLTEAYQFRVFPIAPGTHDQPVIKKWPTRASSDPATFSKYWITQPPHNIGIATGTDLIVVDVDSAEHGGKYDGIETYQAIKDQFPETFTVQTPSNGLHLYYATTPEQIEELNILTCTNWLPGIDIRSNGGYVVGPESTRDDYPGKAYTILNGQKLNNLPVDLFRRVKTRADKKKTAKSASNQSITSSLITSETSTYSSLPDSIPLGQRDDTLFKYACSWRERGYAYDLAKVLMEQLYERCEQKPFDHIRLENAIEKLDRAWREYVPGEREAPPAELSSVAPGKLVEEGSLAVGPPVDIAEALTRFLLIEEGERVADTSKHPKQALMKFATFKLSYKNCKFNGREMSAAWIANRHRQTVRDAIYWPHAQKIINYQGERFFNTYHGSDMNLNIEFNDKKIEIFINHMKYMFPKPDDFKLILQWLILTLQKPEIRIPWAPLIVSKPGVGKSWLYLVMQKLLGDRNCSLIRDRDLESAHNGYYSEKTLVCLDDVKRGKNLHLELDTVLTTHSLLINHKYGGMGTEKIFFNFICFANPGHGITLGQDDRRFWVNESSAVRRDPDYYTQLHDWLDTDGPAHLYLWMMGQDISKFKYAAPPAVTSAKETMIDAALNLYEELIHDAINERTGPFAADIVDRSVAELYIKSELGRDQLSNADINQIRYALARYTDMLPQKRYRVKLNNTSKSKAYSLRVVRDAKKWRGALDGEITDEFIRGYKLALGIR